MSDYTLTTATIRERFADAYGNYENGLEDFDRWFQSETEKAARIGAEEALRIVKEEWYPDE